MNRKPIGVFDSGIGGLTVVRELHKVLPGEDILYFGDTGRVPYGTRSKETIRKYTRQDIAFLNSFGVKHVTAACGTVSATISPRELEGISVPFMGIVKPAVEAAVQATGNKRIGVIATSASIQSGAYGKEAARIDPSVTVVEKACPLLVPLVENGLIEFDNQITRLTARMYLAAFDSQDIDTLILGCTHFPLLYDIVDDLMGHQVTLIDPAVQTALTVKKYLEERRLLNDPARRGNTTYYVSDSVPGFENLASVFLQDQLRGDVKFVDIDMFP